MILFFTFSLYRLGQSRWLTLVVVVAFGNIFGLIGWCCSATPPLSMLYNRKKASVVRLLIFDNLGLFDQPKIQKMSEVIILKSSPQKTDDFRFSKIEKITLQTRNMVFLRLLEKSILFKYFVLIWAIFIINWIFLPLILFLWFLGVEMIPRFYNNVIMVR